MGLPDQSHEELVAFSHSINELWIKHDEELKIIKVDAFTPDEKKYFEEVKLASKELNEKMQKVIILALNSVDKKELQPLLKGDVVKVSDKYRDNIELLIEKEFKQANVNSQSAQRILSMFSKINIAIVLLGLIFGSIFSYLLFNNIISTLKKLGDDLRRSSKKVKNTANKIHVSSDSLAKATSQQAQSLDETSESMDEMRAIVAKNSNSAKLANDLSFDCKRNAEQGQEVITLLITAINEIKQSNEKFMHEINESNRKIEQIAKLISVIANKTKVINDIVFQTKLLSFNASVEAARAGEQGKGFAVVAEEVGNLAEMSGKAAKEISDMLDNSIKDVQNIVIETRSSVEKVLSEGNKNVEAGTDIANQCMKSFTNIVTGVSSIASMNAEILNASAEQSRGVEGVNVAMIHLEEMTDKNAITSKESAHASEDLSAQAEKLRDMIFALIQFVEGKITP
jgi:methyl-accepting chemotaxis protein